MLTSSTALVVGALLGVVSGFTLARFWPKPPQQPPDPRESYLRVQATRLFLAQHWARGGVMSHAGEAWRPALTALGMAALVVRDPDELAPLLAELVEAAGDDPELLNIWQQARGELAGAKRREWVPFERIENPLEREGEIRVSLGKRPDGSPDWNYPELGIRAREMLASACLGARKLLAIRRAPSAPPPA